MNSKHRKKNGVLNLKPWLISLTALVFFPLFSLLFWRMGIHAMDSAGSLGVLASIALSLYFFKNLDFTLSHQPSRYLYGILVFSLFLTFLYYLRLNFEFVDIHCPTNLLGFVSQLRRGHFPVSFLAFPEFPANYHAGFPIIAGYLSRWFGLSEFTALRLLSISVFFIVALGVQLFFLSLYSGWRVMVGALLFFFSFSFPSTYLYPGVSLPVWLKDTSVFDYFRSNSWPLTDLTLLLMLFYFWKRSLTPKNMIIFACFTLLLSIFNATVHALLLITVVLAVIYEIAFIPTSQKRLIEHHFAKLVLLVGLLLMVRETTHLIPTAFMVGDHYRHVTPGLRFLLKGYGAEMKGYLSQCGLLPWLGLSVALPLLIQKRGTALIRGIALLFIIAFFFPVVFYLKTITSWDNYHKFLLTMYFSGSILVFIAWSQAKGKQARFLTVGIVLTLLTSAPNAWKMFLNETSKQPVPAFDADNNDIIQFLKTQADDTQLLPYAKEGYIFCSAYTEVAAASGVFAKDGYCYWFFTLDGLLEADFQRRQEWWKTQETFQHELEKLPQGHQFIIVKREFIKDFKRALHKANAAGAPKLKPYPFKHFILFQVTGL